MVTKRVRKVRRTYPQLFLDKLSEVAPNPEKLIGNKTLIRQLGWEQKPDRYKRVRAELLEQKKIVIARGSPGGSVGLASPLGTKGLSVFVSYSHADEALMVEFMKHLKPLERLGLIDTWHDRKLKPGDEWGNEISSFLKKADIIFLLVSIDFINSSYCYDVELELALDRHEEQKAKVIPVILRNCMWQNAPFAKLQALPKDAKPVMMWLDREEAFLNIAERTRSVAEELLESR